MNTVTELPNMRERCIRVAAKKHTKMSNALNWLHWQHHIKCDPFTLFSINPFLK